MKCSRAKSLQLGLTLCDPIDSSPPGSPVPGILQARTLEWVAISFSNVGKWKVKVKSLSRVWLLGTPWTAAHQAPPSMGFSRQEYWSGVPLPSLKCSLSISNFLEEISSLFHSIVFLYIFASFTVLWNSAFSWYLTFLHLSFLVCSNNNTYHLG